jgi:tetrahydromethanopterin S-methyltransferase subunit A
MDMRHELNLALEEIETGINLTKCQQCGCMSETLGQINRALPALPGDQTREFQDASLGWIGKMKTVRYSCLGCEHCYASVAQNAFTTAFPDIETQFGLSCEIQLSSAGWPPVVGEYIVVDPTAPVAVTTLASPDFTKRLADLKITGLAIVGKLETENIGIDKIIKNVIANPSLRYLILSGIEPQGHLCGQTLLALSQNGVDEKGRVIGSKGKHPVLKNVTPAEIEAFRKQIQPIDLIGCDCIDCVRDKITELCEQSITDVTPQSASCGCSDGICHSPALVMDQVPTIQVEENDQPVKLDRAGYFVILPIPERKVIHVEHYSYDNTLLNTIEGISTRDLYLKMIEMNWVSELSHAAYLGKELSKAEQSLTYGIPYNQDAA